MDFYGHGRLCDINKNTTNDGTTHLLVDVNWYELTSTLLNFEVTLNVEKIR